MSGRDVRQLQYFLRRAGVSHAPRPSGEFDAHTAAAVRRFEAKVQRGVDGVVDAGDIYRLVRIVGDDARPGGDGDPKGVELGALPLAPGDKATLGADGLAVAPETAPLAVRQIIAAGNRIARKPYIFGGGHGSWNAAGYDCSGSVSYALRGAGLLTRPLASYDYFGWGAAGPGSWVTIYTNSGHMFMVVAGLRFDTSGRSDGGSRWQRDLRGTSAYRVRHPVGL
jgi:peptidoglycan hydrolase-like protein with peptidoglycan-binding domain